MNMTSSSKNTRAYQHASWERSTPVLGKMQLRRSFHCAVEMPQGNISFLLHSSRVEEDSRDIQKEKLNFLKTLIVKHLCVLIPNSKTELAWYRKRSKATAQSVKFEQSYTGRKYFRVFRVKKSSEVLSNILPSHADWIQ
mmetsp:Transcript_12519/g.30818  ORF Transcript_12519/g.30818 Transcript_12519/m.30818 type:complete len:139 (+) Transcript_12519:779-1195(+)